MKTTFFIAWRYFFSKNKHNFIHLTSLISLIGVIISTAALILVLSVFNGFEKLILDMYNNFDPHIRITSAEGKTFNRFNLDQYNIIDSNYIDSYSFILEERVLLRSQEKEFIATIKGVDSSYKEFANFEKFLIDESRYFDNYKGDNVAVIGKGVAYYLSIYLYDYIEVFFPNRSKSTLLDPTQAFNQAVITTSGIFSIQAEIDSEYIIAPLSFVQDLTQRVDKVSSLEIRLRDYNYLFRFQKILKEKLGDQYIIMNRLEQQEELYKILNTEKLMVYLILVFIIIIATFNIVGLLSMIILDKKYQINIFRAIGFSNSQIYSIFFFRSILTVIFGVIIGLLLGLFIAILQENIGLINMKGSNFIVDNYPIAIYYTDVLLVFLTVLIVGVVISWLPSRILTNRLLKK